jgi:hypothetical protein
MAPLISTLLLLAASTPIFASPLIPRQTTSVSVPALAPTAAILYVWNEGGAKDFTIHPSCNASQRAYLEKGLQETLTLTRQARDHILRWGNQSEIYRKYFGEAPTGEALGWFTRITDGDKTGVLFRCDNIDGNCENEGQ